MKSTAHSMEPLLAFAGIGKSFFGVPVLRDIHLAIAPGRTVGLVGENGAGKSTLMNLLGGNLAPDAGTMRLAGEAYAPTSPQDATAAGIAFIHQELNLFANLSIGENIFLTAFPRRAGLIDRKGVRERTEQLLREVELAVSPNTLVEDLSPGERQLVEIAKALSIDARLVIFDEPTTSLTAREADRLFGLIRKLQGRGLTLIYISHALGDVLRLCDDVVVLRDGALVGQGAAQEFTIDRLITLMVGRNLQQLYPTRTASPSPEVLLAIEGVSQPGIVADIQFELHRGEILGVAGLMGSGRSEMARVIAGLDPYERGRIWLKGEILPPLQPRAAIARGLAFVTENRREEGLCLEASIAANLGLVALPRYLRPRLPLLDRVRASGAIEQMGRAVRVSGGNYDRRAAKTLSGGNQQKVVLGKWLLNEPEVFLLDEPTRGIDVGAKAEVYQLIVDLAARGAGVLVISSEVEELMGLCDRILVMSRGEIVGRFAREDFDRERILRSALRQEGKG